MTEQEPEEMDGDDPFERGHVVWVEWPDHAESGPFLILSDETSPNHGKEYMGVPLSTAEQEHAVRITSTEWETGGLDEASFALTWRLQTIPHGAIEQGIGGLSDEAVDEVARAVESVLQVE